ncbi:MAG: hypothetical protein IPJ88_11335 [Myxococcales bacterium]|nr:MAG: hypothetical protein IPJ88_11335 [Myxococcales bacterium]
MKLMEHLLDQDGVVAELLALLENMDTEYERDPQRKIQVLAALEEREDSRISQTIVRFLDDVNETVRFHAVGALFNQAEVEGCKDALENQLMVDESMRVRARILDGYAAHAWPLPAEKRKIDLPTGYRLDAKGIPVLS